MVEKNINFINMMSVHAKQVMEFLLLEKIEFGIVVHANSVAFEPDLPEEILKTFSSVVFFMLSNYTYSTIKLEQNKISFEAGFGSENIGHIVEVLISGIAQIIVNDKPVFINISDQPSINKINGSKKIKSPLEISKINSKSDQIFKKI